MFIQKNIIMKKVIFSIIILASATGFASCSKAEEDLTCADTKIAKVLKVEGPKSMRINTELTLNISIEGLNGCAGFDNYSETTVGNTTEIITTAKYQGCACTQALITLVVPYKFIKSTPGDYVLKFSQPDNSFVTYNITVQ